ncbi:PQQ-binding-like beta-propeller repeat protein [Cellulomonas cellasea]|uniref:Pyrrolo-quinoline quinone repeat domain-containing protein n=2 Tax=Cellulomonas cellasea TaxID=43670 RepID=A0A0A0B5U8_9CELL|nr:PQQ-binding-like beta-propeller repeat protein [Cellulomonas cellasea]KGM01522.1 hypothetical protein Q760_00725 [Cellulomonas cellasea DSM 20118]GEA87097.1 hypothetical protein CCE01nite_10460 [Cellulomonas cellasea]
MSPNLRDLLHELADHEAAGAAATAPDTRTEVRHVMTDIRTRRTHRLAVVGAVAVTVLAVGAATATALTPSPRVPAVDPTLSPTPTAAPATTPSPSSTPAATRAPQSQLGLVAPLPTAPRELWTVRTADLGTGWSAEAEGAPYLGSISAWPQGYGYHAAAAGDTWVVALGDENLDERLVGIDARTGEHLWDLPTYAEETDAALLCAGTAGDGSLVCLSATDTSARLLLLDPGTGTTVRELPLDVVPYSIGLDGDLAVVHGADLDAGSAFWQGVSTVTGEVAWSHVEPGLTADLPEGLDWESDTRVHAGVARLVGAGYDVDVDVRTGALLSSTGHEPLVVDVDGRVGTLTFRIADAGDGGTRLSASSGDAGPELWAYEGPGASVVGVVGDGVVVSGTESFALLDATTGRVRWSSPARTLVAFDGTRLVTTRNEGADRVLEALDVADGTASWSVPIGARVPVRVGDALLLTDFWQGTLTALAG